MADDWAPVNAPRKKESTDDWAPVGVSATSETVAITPGEKQFREDERLVKEASGAVPGGLKAAAYSGANALLLNAPSHVIAKYTALKEGKPYEEAFKEQKRYEEALERQYPISSGVGTAAGIGAGLLVPMGAVGQAGRALKAGTSAKLAGTAAPEVVKRGAASAAEALPMAGVAGGMTGVSSALEKPVTEIDTDKALKDAAIGAGIGQAAGMALPALGRYFTKFPNPLDAAGNLTPEAQRAVDQAFGKRLDPATVDTFKAELVDVFKRKGASEATAREALAAKEGIPATRSLVTGERPVSAASDISEGAIIKGAEALEQRAAGLAGPSPASPYAAAESVYGAERGARGAYQTVRGAVEQAPGQFKVEAFDKFLPAIESSLMAKKLPTSFENTSLFPQASAAKKFIEEGIASGNLPSPNQPFNFDNVELVRRELNSYWGKASPTDRRAVSAMIDGFDNGLEAAIRSNLFTGNGRQVITDLKQSRDLWTEYKNKFYDNKGPGGKQFSQVMNSLIDKQAGMISSNLPEESAKAAQGIINAGLLNKTTGLSMYNRLEKALGAGSPEMQTVREQIRNMVVNTQGDLTKIPTSVDKFLAENSEIAKKVFKPDEIADMRRLSESIKMIANKKMPNDQKESLILKALQKGTSGVAALINWNLHGPLAGAATYLVGEVGRSVVRGAREAAQRSAERAGAPMLERKAPESFRFFETAPEVTAPVRNIEPLLDESGELSQYQAPAPLGGARPGRKEGGRVGKLSDRLISAAERAKKSINNDTKAILNVDDSHVARALEIANRNLEG